MTNKKSFYVYAHTRPDTRMYFYIGIGFNNRAYCKSGRNTYWHRIVNKNNGNYKIDILNKNLTRSEACEIEILLIKLYGRNDLKEGLLCNMSKGGEVNNGYKHSPEQIAKAKLRTGENHNMFGIPKPESVKRKISKTKKGFKMSIENKEKISIALKEKYKNQEHPSKGIKFSKERLEKHIKMCKETAKIRIYDMSCITGLNSPQSKGRVYQYDKDSNELIAVYDSTGLAEKGTGVHSGRITDVIIGKRNQAKGFIFKRL